MQPASLSRVLGDPALKARADNPLAARLWYTSIVAKVAPLDNIECRKAVMLAADRTEYQTAYGGPEAGGQIATGLMPPQIPGYQKLEYLPRRGGQQGRHRQARRLRSQPAASPPASRPPWPTAPSARRRRRRQKACSARSLGWASSSRCSGIPTGEYFSTTVGRPQYLVDNKIGLATNGWGADWNDGFGFLSQITDSRVIRATGGSSNLSVRIPEVDALIDKALARQRTPRSARRSGLRSTSVSWRKR